MPFLKKADPVNWPYLTITTAVPTMTNTRLNFNLLICLHHILQEQSVSLAARKMFVTQSAMSKSLAQLREQLNDPIIIRNRGGVTITATAREMQKQVAHIVSSAFHLFENATFHPEISTKKFVLVCDEFTTHKLLPPLIKKIMQQAPSISIELIPATPATADKISSGDVDLSLNFTQTINTALHTRTLLSDRLVMVMHKTHPLATENMSSANFSDYPNIALTLEKFYYSQAIQLINAHYSRNVVVYLPSLYMLLDSLRQGNYIAILPKMSVNTPEENCTDFIYKEISPTRPEYDLPLYLSWHATRHHGTCSKWMRSQIISYFKNR